MDNCHRGEGSMRTIMTHYATTIATLLLLFPSTSAAAPATDPCALLTTAQVSAALGGAVGPAKPLVTGVCQWTQQGKPGDVLMKLDVSLISAEHFTRLKTVTIGTVTNVSGLGDYAFYSTFTQGHTTLTTLNIKKGTAAVTIRVSGGTKPAEEYQAKEKAVAVALLSKL
jgi:hypothetical protein